MKVTCKTKNIREAIELGSRMVGKQLALPILQALYIQVSGKTIKIRATNLSVGVEVEVLGVVEREGEVLVKGEIINTILQNNTSESLTLELEQENLVISTTTSRQKVKVFPLEEFPTLPVVEGEKFTLSVKEFSEGIRSVVFASAINEIKPEIASVFIYTDTFLTFVGTDSFRLAEKKIKIKNSPDISKILLPIKTIPEILRVVDTIREGALEVVYNKNQLSLRQGGLYFTTRLIDGAFPDYRQIIPKEIKTKIVLLKQELLSVVKLSSVFVDKFSQIIFSVLPEEKKVRIFSKNAEVGTSETILSSAIDGAAIEISFNLKYFLDALQALPGDSVSIECTEQNRPIVIKSVQDTSFLCLLMPTYH